MPQLRKPDDKPLVWLKKPGCGTRSMNLTRVGPSLAMPAMCIDVVGPPMRMLTACPPGGVSKAMTMGVFEGALASPPWITIGPIGAMTLPLNDAQIGCPTGG